MTTVRDATEADLPRILEITNEAIANTTAVWSLVPATLESRKAWMLDRQSRGFPILVADQDGAVLGFASYGDYRPWDGYLHTVEHSIYVHPDAQGRGVGRALLAALVERAEAQGKHAMVAGIEAGNTASIALHRRAGFEEAGQLRQVGRKFGRWLDLLFMQKLFPGPANPDG
ncbi:N-acetyltransferase family protein (plasmid) [Azospirillum argentinense]|uniref:N-acetyltransferase family protein n=1 Tax=Azospirillum argentinense TaxID=2970906 RepID=A0A4D8PPM7_9PROT|nr:GNAT family N-acetyltransferase [Azospirillum argentinense]QCO00454.1 N-acetyltransferase family protein [Azospirillum argentinense]